MMIPPTETRRVANKTWGGRFVDPTDPRVVHFTESISFDRRLFEHDIRGSIAHARMLAQVGLVTADECEKIVQGLSEIQAEIESGRFPFAVEREDIHMHIEQALTDRLGDVGRKLHTARSRNDQVATDLKLWTRDELDGIDRRLADLQRAFVGAAERHRDVVLPGYTHMQRAQPVLAPHYFLAYVEKLARDRDRLADCRRRLNVLPLGAAALAGTSLPIDRDHVARALGFDGVAANSLDVSSDRDFAIEAIFVLVLVAEHLSGWAEEWVLWSTQEFSFLELPDAVCTGSSIMPQKKNPDVLELIRGRTARVIGALTTLLVLVKGLPLAYNRDLQEDKRPLFDAFDTVGACLELAAVVVEGAELRADRIAERLEEGFLDATTLMEYLIQKGVPQRTGHDIVGQLVDLCLFYGCRLADLPDEDYADVNPSIDPGVKAVLGVVNAVRSFRSYGSTAPDRVGEQLDLWKSRLGIVDHVPAIAQASHTQAPPLPGIRGRYIVLLGSPFVEGEPRPRYCHLSYRKPDSFVLRDYLAGDEIRENDPDRLMRIWEGALDHRAARGEFFVPVSDREFWRETLRRMTEERRQERGV
jgi:argininosuccinate lyase